MFFGWVFDSCHVYTLLMVISLFLGWSWRRICLSCLSDSGMGSFPVCAICMIWSSSCSVNSGLIILRLVSLCLASGVRICLRSACFCDSICSSWDCLCSLPDFCCIAWSFLRLIASSSSSLIFLIRPDICSVLGLF